MNNQEKDCYQLYKLIFNNIVLSKIIFKFVKLLRNDSVIFKSRQELLEYKEREFIRRLEIRDDHLKEGDIPTSDLLKELVLENIELANIESNLIPMGVKIIEFTKDENYFYSTIPLSKLPSSVHTVKNAVLSHGHSFTEKELGNYNIRDYFSEIPPNITSLSFRSCISISPTEENIDDECIAIPNTIKTLKLSGWENDDFYLSKGDLPEGLTNLKIKNYDCQNLEVDSLPTSIKKLSIEYSGESTDFIPENVEILNIDCLGADNQLDLSNFQSLVKLKLQTYNFDILPNHFPNSLTDLSISNLKQSELQPNAIPQSITKLYLYFNYGQSNQLISNYVLPDGIITLKSNRIFNQYPQSLKKLKIFGSDFNSSNKDLSISEINNMIPNLPESLKSITLPKSVFDFKFNLPKTINKIKFKSFLN